MAHPLVNDVQGDGMVCKKNRDKKELQKMANLLMDRFTGNAG